MVEVIKEWAGKERPFRLNFGGVLDLEEAIGEGIGHVFVRVAGGKFSAKDVYHTIRLALIGGGATIVQADGLMKNHFDARPYLVNAALAGEILTALMAGVEDSETSGSEDVPPPHKFSEVSQICRVFNVSPLEVREMRYSDFVNMLKGYNAATQHKAPHLSEDEFMDILSKYEPEAVE